MTVVLLWKIESLVFLQEKTWLSELYHKVDCCDNTGLDPKTTPVSNVMTPNPIFVSSTSPAADSLDLMVSRHFRHLPVIDYEDEVETICMIAH